MLVIEGNLNKLLLRSRKRAPPPRFELGIPEGQVLFGL